MLIDGKFILHMCTKCDGEGETYHCDDQSRHESNPYQNNDDTPHVHEVKPCVTCKGLCLVLIPIAKLTVL